MGSGDRGSARLPQSPPPFGQCRCTSRGDSTRVTPSIGRERGHLKCFDRPPRFGSATLLLCPARGKIGRSRTCRATLPSLHAKCSGPGSGLASLGRLLPPEQWFKGGGSLPPGHSNPVRKRIGSLGLGFRFGNDSSSPGSFARV